MSEHQLRLFHVSGDEEKELFEKRCIIKLPLDTLILIGTIILVLVIVSFSLGIVRGRKTAYIHHKRVEKKEKTDKVTHENTLLEKRTIEKDKKEKAYIVQVACFVKEKTAHQEKKHLQKSGFPALITKKGKYLVVSVGEFETKQEAEKTKSILKKRYNDCFIRRL